jgi:rSAM/selenodomain-associated transferase 1
LSIKMQNYQNMPRAALIIFVKNPIEGNVKTRIAKTVGHTLATEIYCELLEHTRSITETLPVANYTKTVYYGDFINENDLWYGWAKALQPEGDLGARMKQAFREQFENGAERVVIIGSDCLALQAWHLEEGFQALQTNDAVIGPSTDGGYYLLGMNRLQEELFDGMPWSQPMLMEKTTAALESRKLTYHLLPPLTDIDEWADYVAAKKATAASKS